MIVVGISSQQSQFFPFRSFIVTTGSMIPTILPGDVVFTQPKPDYAVQDIVTFVSTDKHVITHRIIEKHAGEKVRFVTKGDNNKTVDAEVVENTQIIGALKFKLPQIGKILVLASKPTVIFLLLAIPILSIVGTELLKEKKKK